MKSRRKKSSRRELRALAALILAAGSAGAPAQSIYLPNNNEPTLTMPRLKYISMDAEVEDVSYTTRPGGTTKSQRIYLAPSVGIGWDYFIYHPDLLTFSLLAEPGYTWQQYNYAGATSRQTDLLLNGNFNATLLQLKPYATTFNYSRSHEEYQYDFFNSAMEDVQNWGVNTGYRAGAIPVTVSFGQSSRDSTGLAIDSTTAQTTLSLQAQNSRRNEDLTSLNYQFSQYDSSSTFTSDNFKDSSTTHYVTLTDAEHFGKNTLNSSLIYNEQELNGVPSDNLNSSLDFDMELTAHLRSFYDYSLVRYTTPGVDSINQLARAGLKHQLYDSLSSMVEIHSSTADNNSPGATLDQLSYGASASVDYSKNLGAWGHLTINDDAGYDLTHQSSSGTELFINGESHTVPPNGLFFLTQPLNLSVQSITYFNGSATVTLVRGTAPAGDYDVITTTDPWQIQIYSTGPNHLNLSSSPAVQVNYTVQPNPTGSYSVFNDQFQIRVAFWHERAGIFARYSFTDNQASSPGFVLENLSEFQAGADLSWDGFRADANFTDRQSSLYNYQSLTLSEGYSLRISKRSTAGIDLRQQWSSYPGTGTSQSPDATYYSFTGHYDWQPVSGLSWHSEVGYEQQSGEGEDQGLFAARSYLNWFVGKLQLRLGYELQNQQYTAETRERNYVFMRMRRNF